MKPMGVTLKASIIGAVIGGIFTLAATMLPSFFKSEPKEVAEPSTSNLGVAPVVSTVPIGKSHSGVYPLPVGLVLQAQKNPYLIKIEKLTGLTLTLDDDVEIGIFSTGTNEQDSFYFIAKAAGRKFAFYYGVISERNGFPELIQYNSGYPGESVKYVPFGISDLKFVLINNFGGSGGFLTSSYFSYDGINKPNLILLAKDIGEGGIGFFGENLIIYGASQRLSVVLNGRDLKVVKYNSRFTTHPNNTLHVLRIDPLDEQLLFTYDGRSMPMGGLLAERTNSEPISIDLGSVVVIDDNSNNPNGFVRVLTNTSIHRNPGLFETISFGTKGLNTLLISNGYGDWYRVVFDVE